MNPLRLLRRAVSSPVVLLVAIVVLVGLNFGPPQGWLAAARGALFRNEPAILPDEPAGNANFASDPGEATLSVLSPFVFVAPEVGAEHLAVDGEGLNPWDIVLTDGPGCAVVTLVDGSEIRLTPGTAVQLVPRAEDDGSYTLYGVTETEQATEDQIVVQARSPSSDTPAPRTVMLNRGSAEPAKDAPNWCARDSAATAPPG